MLRTYTTKCVKTGSGGQLVEWMEVISEGTTIEECKEMVADVENEMIATHWRQNKEIPVGSDLLEQIQVEV